MADYSFKEESIKMLKLIRYIGQWKQNLVAVVFFYLAGIIFVITGGFSITIGALYMMIAGSIQIQGYEQIFFTSYMNTSARHRYYSVDLYSLFMAVSFTIGYVLAIICLAVKDKLINMEWNGRIQESISEWDTGINSGAVLVFAGIMGMIMIIYYSVASKAYISTTIIFFVTFFPIFMIMLNVTSEDDFNDTPMALGIIWKKLDVSFGKGAVIGFLLILLGVAIVWLLRRVTYNKQYSPLYKKALLRFSK